ncbi:MULTISPECIES: hypothetical protein [Campylobacter]|uniref:hypothetical protein n=1 Tax=Campylobacter TaxID=194 RepID=UPI0023F17DEE|nr:MULTISPECIES: hypothetical protein [Campylobacter]MCI6641344.1 hypothetical protein [Campylobacter sp.]MDD7423290.1 hypothetical protein [Campylobacter hominis]MDY3117718.1 hypothetical protein [Campylobacter hominis]
MFLKEFENDEIRKNLIKLAVALSDDLEIANYYIAEINLECNEGFNSEFNEILSLKNNEEELKEAVLKLLDGADFKFYLEFLMIVSLNPNKFTNEIKKELEEKLNLSENLISLSNNLAINTASHINNAIKIIDSVNQ